MEPEVQSTASKASRNNNVDEEEDLEAALAKIRDALQSTSSRPGYLHLRHSLLYADDDVQIVQVRGEAMAKCAKKIPMMT